MCRFGVTSYVGEHIHTLGIILLSDGRVVVSCTGGSVVFLGAFLASLALYEAFITMMTTYHDSEPCQPTSVCDLVPSWD